MGNPRITLGYIFIEVTAEILSHSPYLQILNIHYFKDYLRLNP